MKTLCIDIDGVLCKDMQGNYEQAIPFKEAIITLNELYDRGHHIIIYTARGSKSGINWKEFTEKQLKKWNVKYHKLLLGKPSFDVIVDDKSVKSIVELSLKI